MTIQVENLRRIKAELKGRARLVAVSKTYNAETILPILHAGQRTFGENRVQEAAGKWPALRLEYPGVELHLIGPLQSNKVAEAVALFDVIQTVDRPKIAQALSQEMKKQGRNLSCYVQVNIGDEFQKSGIAVAELSAFLEECRIALGLNIHGLMCIPPVDKDARPYFQHLRQLAERHELPGLSMGMSGDYAIAVEEGATSVRIGSAIFGSRPQITK